MLALLSEHPCFSFSPSQVFNDIVSSFKPQFDDDLFGRQTSQADAAALHRVTVCIERSFGTMSNQNMRRPSLLIGASELK